MKNRPVYYSMLDPRWRWKLYDINPADGPDYIGTAGCGPTTAAMLAAELTEDRTITPETMAQFAIDHGDRTMSNGTARSLFAHVGQAYGLKCQETTDTEVALDCLRDGGLVVCHVGPGRWTTGGHYILWWGCDGTNVAINDPSGDTAKRNTGTLAELKACRKAYVCFWPKEKETPPVQVTPAPEPWYKAYREWVVSMGIADGTRPDDTCTRAETWAMLQRMYEAVKAGK